MKLNMNIYRLAARLAMLLIVAVLFNQSRSSIGAEQPAAKSIMKAEKEVKSNFPAPTPTGKETGLIPREVFFGNPDKAGGKMSYDGKLFSYLAAVDGVLNVWVGPIDDPAKAKPITAEKKRPIHMYSWAYTNKHILYSQDTDGNENFDIYVTDVATGKTTNMTNVPTEKGKQVTAHIVEASYKFPNEILIGLNDRNETYHDIYRLNILTGEKKLIQKNDEFAGFVTDEDYRVRFAQKMTPDGGEVVMQPDGDKWKEFMKIGMEDAQTTSLVGFDKTGDVLYLIDSRGRDTGALKTLDLKTNKETLVAEDPRCDTGGIMAHPTENTIQAVSFTYDRIRRVFFDKEVEADFAKLKTVADGEVTIASRTLDDKQWIVVFLMDNGPARYYFYDRTTKKEKFLFTNRKSLEGLPLQKMQSHIIKSRDGLNLVSYLTLPPGADKNNDGKPDQPVPLILNVHGGPWARDGWGFDPEHQLYANRGYAVLSVNFRCSTGFGKKFFNAGIKEWGAKMHDDLIDAVDWAVKEKIADPNKVAIMGGSYGGYATLVGLTFTPDKFACGVDIVGPSSLVTLLNSIPAYWGPALQMFKDRVGDHTTEEGKKFLNTRSPLNFVEKIKKPLLIGQGAKDPRVTQLEADQMVKAMEAKKIPVTYVLMPDEGHGFHRPNNNMAFYAVTEAFYAVHLGGRYEEVGKALDGSTIQVPAGENDVPGLEKALSNTEIKDPKTGIRTHKK